MKGTCNARACSSTLARAVELFVEMGRDCFVIAQSLSKTQVKTGLNTCSAVLCMLASLQGTFAGGSSVTQVRNAEANSEAAQILLNAKVLTLQRKVDELQSTLAEKDSVIQHLQAEVSIARESRDSVEEELLTVKQVHLCLCVRWPGERHSALQCSDCK